MKDSFTVSFTLDTLGYIFHRDGTITPCVRPDEPIEFPDQTIVSRLPLDPHRIAGVYDVAKHDRVTLTLSPKGNSLTIDERLDEVPETVPHNTCPICGAQLLPSQYGIGRCVNIECAAQMSQTILTFLSVIGTVFDDVSTWIVERILNRGVLSSPLDLYNLSIPDLIFTEVPIFYIQVFLSTLHSKRGNVNIATLLKSLPRVIPLSEAQIKTLGTKLPQNLSDAWMAIFAPEVRKNIPANWEAFDQHMQIGRNAAVMDMLVKTMNT